MYGKWCIVMHSTIYVYIYEYWLNLSFSAKHFSFIFILIRLCFFFLSNSPPARRKKINICACRYFIAMFCIFCFFFFSFSFFIFIFLWASSCLAGFLFSFVPGKSMHWTRDEAANEYSAADAKPVDCFIYWSWWVYHNCMQHINCKMCVAFCNETNLFTYHSRPVELLWFNSKEKCIRYQAIKVFGEAFIKINIYFQTHSAFKIWCGEMKKEKMKKKKNV